MKRIPLPSLAMTFPPHGIDLEAERRKASSYDWVIQGKAEDVMIATEQLSDLRKWASEAARKTGEDVRLNRAVDIVSSIFNVTGHEVAILGVTADGRFLKFLAPKSLKAVGQIPLSSGSALAVRSVREMRPEVINHFYAVPHASVFEGVPVSETERGEPIQKIMSAPIMAGGKAIGVVQVSRKGKTTAEAGADFTPQQLQTLKTISDVLAPCLPLAMQE